jgi:glycosyltransferase involved in cell wall biosynthesis
LLQVASNFGDEMRIAVNTRYLLNEHLQGKGIYITEIFKRITTQHPEHQFIFIFDRPFDKRFIFSDNVKGIVTGPKTGSAIWRKFWFDFRVPPVLKKYKVDVFVSLEGKCSLNTSVPQCLVLPDLLFKHFPKHLSRSDLLFDKKFVPKFIQKAKVLATVSGFSAKDIAAESGITLEKIAVIPYAARSIFKRIDADEKDAVKDQYTRGKEYFIYTGSIGAGKNLINLLKAFSLFKKRQNSNLQLVITGHSEKLTKIISTYKFREDIVLTGFLDEAELARIISGAYAMVYPSVFEGFGLPVLEAMRTGVPVITSAGTAMDEISKGAALLADPADIGMLAEKMMLIYKDERLRQVLIEKGIEVEKEYSWDKSAAELWKCILMAVD